MYILLRLIRILIIGLVLFFIYRLLFKGNEPKKNKRRRNAKKRSAAQAIEEMKKDPVCGTYVPESQGIKYQQGKTTCFFCSPECQKKFLQLQEKDK